MNWIQRLLAVSFWQRIDYETEQSYKDAVHWYMNFQPVCDDYESVLNFAESKYEEIKSAFDIIDKKAEWCFGLASAATAALIAFPERAGLSFNAVLPVVVILLWSMHLALRSRIPCDVPTSFGVNDAIERHESTGKFQAWKAASLHCATKGMERIVAWKTESLVYAVRMQVAAMIVLCCLRLIAEFWF